MLWYNPYMKRNMPRLGAHVSAQGGFTEALSRAEAMGATAMQIFGSSPRTWSVRMPDEGEVRAFRARLSGSPLRGAVYLHAAYLVNAASVSPDIYRNSVKSLAGHLNIAEMIGAEGLIFHLGSSKGGSREEGIRREAAAIKKVLEEVPGRAMLFMENTAGGGDKIGASIEDSRDLLRAVGSDRLALCFDTAHGFEAGLVPSYTERSIRSLFDAWEKETGAGTIRVIHANDSMTESGSHHDRHENIGEGHIGIKGFKALAGDARLRSIPWILEVPGFDGEGPDRKNLDLLRNCFV